MPKTPSILIDIATRHQVFLEGHKTHIAEQFGTFLQEMAKSIDKRLKGRDLTAFNIKRLESLIGLVRDDLKDIYSDHFKTWREQIVDLAQYEAGFEKKSLQQVLDIDYDLPSRTQLKAAVFSKPLTGITGVDGGKLLPAFYKGWTSKTIERVQGVIRSGYYQGQTTPQIVRLIKGTAGAGFRDGQLARGNKDITMLTRTALQHASGEAREETWRANKDIIKGIRITATLDDRTTAQCQLLDGEVFPIDDGPRPPFHVGACVKGTLVTTKKGLIPIEDVCVGDFVLTHRGNWKKVYTVMCRPHKGKILKLINNFGESVSLTDDHPVLTKSKGWINVRDVNVGDVLFNNAQELEGFPRVGKPSYIPNGVLVDSHNIKSDVAEELISYGIFSTSSGMSSAVKLNNSVSNNEIRVKCQNSILSGKIKFKRLKQISKKLLVQSRVFSKSLRYGISGLNFGARIGKRVFGFHTLRTFFGIVKSKLWICLRPMVVPFWDIYKFLIVSNRLNARLCTNVVSDTMFSDSVITKPVLSLNTPKTFPLSPVFSSNKPFNVNAIHDNTPSKKFYASSCTSLVEIYNYNDYVYNLAVEDDETYIANGFVVHNCRTTTVAALDERYDFLDKGATRASRDPEDGRKIVSVPAKQTYYEWLKNQTPEFQDSVIGPTRGKLLRDGGLSATRFKELSLDKNFKPLTLKEMRDRDPLAFKRAFGGGETSGQINLSKVRLTGTTRAEVEGILGKINPAEINAVNALNKPTSISVKGKAGQYNPRTFEITVDPKEKGGNVFLHEYGHHIDVMASKQKKGLAHGHFSSTDKGFVEAFSADRKGLGLHSRKTKFEKMQFMERELFRKKVVKVTPTVELKRNVPYTIGNGGISDIIDAMSGGVFQESYGAYGHGRKYYRQPGAKEQETFANLFSLRSRPEWEKAKELFPKLTKRYDEIIGEIAE